MRPRRHLVIFARFPQAGTGKRRLASGIGAIQALRFQRVRLAILLQRHGRDPRWETWLAVTPDRSGPWPAHVPRIAQGQGDLGVRMGRVMSDLPCGPVVLVGTDIPGITSAVIARSFTALGNHDVVFGPANDGGYWLVGLKRCPRLQQPFSDVRWSSAFALTDTLKNLAGRRVAFVDRLDDVDDAVSLNAAQNWNRQCIART